jgi:putative nucleotidyltransferase with HDIG domain
MKNTSVAIVKTLQDAGHTAYWAGGCVRDMLMGIHPKDYDIATSADPDEIEDLFEDTYAIGKAFGVITVVENEHHFEIATFRSDSGYSDGRRPDAIEFSHPAEDAKRRDFTINGLFFDPVNEEIHDYVGGQDDIKNKLVRFIGDPHERILEDHLRIIRAVRFKNTLDFGYHPDTYHAIKKHAALADKVSWERVRDELNKILSDDKAGIAFEDMQDTDVLPYVLPELEACKGIAQPAMYHHEGDVWTHTMMAVESLPPDTPINARWATLLHDIGKPETFKVKERIRFDEHAQVSAEIATRILRRLRFSRKDIEEITWAVEHHFMMQQLLDMPLGRKRHWFLDPKFPTLLTVFYADAAGIEPLDLSLYEKVKAAYEECLEKFESRPEPLLTGDDVMKTLDLKPGQKVGEILDEAMEKQLGHDFETKEEALAWLKSL